MDSRAVFQALAFAAVAIPLAGCAHRHEREIRPVDFQPTVWHYQETCWRPLPTILHMPCPCGCPDCSHADGFVPGQDVEYIGEPTPASDEDNADGEPMRDPEQSGVEGEDPDQEMPMDGGASEEPGEPGLVPEPEPPSPIAPPVLPATPNSDSELNARRRRIRALHTSGRLRPADQPPELVPPANAPESDAILWAPFRLERKASAWADSHMPMRAVWNQGVGSTATPDLKRLPPAN